MKGQGALFKNDRKQKPTHPDYRGNFTLTRDLLEAYTKAMGTSGELKVNMAAWLKDGKSGKFLSMAIEAPYEGGQSAPSRPASRPVPDDDMPF